MYQLKKNQIKFKDFPLKSVLLIFIISTIIIYLYKSLYLGTIKFSLKKIFNGWLFLTFYVGYFFSKDKKKVFKFILFSGSIAAIYGVFNFIANGSNAKGFYSHALTAANNWALVLIVSFFSFLNDLKNKYFIITFLIIFIGLICSAERGPILYFTISVILCCFLMLGKKKGIILASIIFFTILFSVFSSSTVFERFKVIFSNNKVEDGGVIVRLKLWKSALNIIEKHPIIGCPEKFKEYMRKITKEKELIRSHPHNGFLTIWVKYGGISLILFLLVFYKVLKDMISKIKENKFAVLGLCLTILYLLEGLTENNFGDSEVKMLFWFLLGNIYSVIYKDNRLES